MGFFRCRTRGTKDGCSASGGSGQRGSQRRPGADPSPRPRPAATPRDCPPRRGGAAGSLLALARLPGRACSAAGSPATLGAQAAQHGPVLPGASKRLQLWAPACPVRRWLLGARSLGPPR
ncbi:hypothetical protein NN561_017676 [Cricetulus griseus]